MNQEIYERTNALPRSLRTDLIKGLEEAVLHRHLKCLLERMNRAAHIEITHGQRELGKDLVMVVSDDLATNITTFVVKHGDISGRTAGLPRRTSIGLTKVLSTKRKVGFFRSTRPARGALRQAETMSSSSQHVV